MAPRSGHRRKTKTGEALPAELQEEILVRLPVKDLVRTRSVCKAWKTLIDSTPFKKKHLQLAKTSHSTLLLCRSVNAHRSRYRLDGDSVPTLHFLSPTSHFLSPSLDYHHLVDPTFTDKKTPVNFHPDDVPLFEEIGVANGLVLLTWNKFPVVWNPLSDEFRKIDPPPKFEAPKDCPALCGSVSTIGFDTKTQDYKILFAYFSSNMGRKRGMVTYQLYSMRSGSWKTVSVRFAFVFLLRPADGFLDGKFYWSAMECSNKDGSVGPGIVFFDFTDETFGLMPLPVDLVSKVSLVGNGHCIVVTTRGFLEIIASFPEGEEGSTCEIWGMGEDGLWSRKLGLSLPSGVEIPRGVSKDGQLICESLSHACMTGLVMNNHFGRRGSGMDINQSEILLINPTTGECKNLGHGACRFGIFTYVESLFSINQ